MTPRSAPLAGALVLVGAQNVVANRLAPEALYVPLNVAAAGVLVALARADGRHARGLGFARSAVRPGIRWGGRLALLAAGGIVVGALLPPSRGLFRDERVADLSAPGVAYQVMVRIPLGTVLLEEVAFRGALLSMLGSRVGVRRAVATSSALFGAWHVLPTLSALELNRLAPDALARAGAVAGSVVVTGIGGVFLCWLRLRSRSLVAPALLHWAANGVATVAAALVLRHD